MSLTNRRIGFGREIYMFVDRVRSQVERSMAAASSSLYVTSYGIEGSELPLSHLTNIKIGNGIYLWAND